MRKAQKKQAERFTETLAQAHREIEKALKHKNRVPALGLLEQCQNRAVELGTMIEEQEGEGFPAVGLLEQYCEGLYQLYERIRLEETVNERKEYKILQMLLTQIQNSIRNDIPVRQEAVFLPYKASMWDSLESIWRAADEDPDCDAYVIPIPYYDKKPDGSPGRMHYEGEQYPEEIPVMDYRSYDFADRHPDLIFIHNPYDDCNSVTSVLPFFYSANLKKFTEKLVYVPYFVLEEINPDDRQAVANLTDFCILPGVVYAHRVIVQSENMRKAYIKALVGEFGSKYEKYWENKILGIGSPKTDRVLAAKRKEQKIPEEWVQIIRKSDGSRRKIILYNTSVTALLRHEGRMLEKMADVFRFFKKNQEEVALLWRPHPLIQATIESLRPQLWEAYRKLTEQYRKEGWGIYDDTADVDRAIAVSDAYYGDTSSLVHLCRSVGMPVMIQDVDVLERIG